MTISIKELETEREKLKKDFDDLKMNIGKVEVDLGAMKSNLNAENEPNPKGFLESCTDFTI